MLKLGTQFCAKCVLTATKLPVTRVKPVKIGFQLQTVRNVTFFNKLDDTLLWKGYTGVSNAGKKRGRGKGTDKKVRKNLRIGKKMGIGKEGMVWPGLTVPVISDNFMPNITQRDDFREVEKPLDSKALRPKKYKVHPLNRGWTGGTLRGMKLDQTDEVHKDFESIIIESYVVNKMTGLLGKIREQRALVVTGNKKGLFGFEEAIGLDMRATIRMANTKALKALVSFNFLEKNTVNHDFFSQYNCTKLYVYKKPEGFGVQASRVLKACCSLIGINNLYVEIEGNPKPIFVIKAFVLGLLKQKSYQEIAEETKLHLVEFREDCYNYPKVMASPNECMTPEEARKVPVLYEEYIMDNKLVLHKPKPVPFFEKLPSYETHLKRTIYKRNHDKEKIDLLVRYNYYRSHLADVYPECVQKPYIKRSKQEKEE